MNISIDVSYYPLKEEFKVPIKDFIRRLNQYPALEVQTNGMSTQVFGEYDAVMKALVAEMKDSFNIPHSVFILKIINASLQKNSQH